MSDEKTPAPTLEATTTAQAQPTSNAVAVQPLDSLAELDSLDFLLEEIENKIAPLALA